MLQIGSNLWTEVVSFSNRAADWFMQCDSQAKRLILETTGSNLFLANKKLNIQANKPFRSSAKTAHKTRLLGDMDSNHD